MKFQVTAEEARAHFTARADVYEKRAESIRADVIIRPDEAKMKEHLLNTAKEFRWAAEHVADGKHDVSDDEIATLEFIPPADVTMGRLKP